ncbi:MAG: hypothetical protein ABI904_16165 [Chloroflexota bacterium]
MSETNSKFLSDRLFEEYERQQALLSAQPAIIQRFLEAQGKQIAEAVIDGAVQVRFSLPDRVVCTLEHVDQPVLVTIPQSQRTYSSGSFINRLRKVELHKDLRHSLTQLEQSPDRAVSVAAGLLRHAAVLHMVNNMLPAGRTVAYKLADEEETIPSVPEADALEPESAITSASDAIAEEGKTEEGRGDLLVPFVPFARKFFLPQWVAFNENGDLLAKSVEEAEAHVKSMQRFMEVLFLAVALAPYISVDEEYIKKRYGMLGQLVNQGRALAIYQAKEIIARIKERASSGNLNRGLSLSLPYFDDQELRVDITKFEVIPAGRIMFVPAFVVRAVRQEEVKVGQDTRFNPATRNHLLYLLGLLEQAFQGA